MNQYIHNYEFPINKNQIVIIHNRSSLSRFEELNIKTKFISMSVNVNSIPKTNNKINDRWLYVSNIRDGDGKLKLINKLRQFINIDVISFGHFNDNKEILSHKNVLDIMATYTYGIGIGRVALEMLTAGIKCLVVGSNYGGPILNNNDLLLQLQFNCNAEIVTTRSISEDIDLLINSDVSINTDAIDMRNKVADYMSVLNSSLYL